MALAKRQPGTIISLETESTVFDGCIVVVGSADDKCALPAGADPVGGVLGVVMRPDQSNATSGMIVDIVTSGVYVVKVAAAVTRGDLIAVNAATGLGKTCAIGAGTNSNIVGTALETAGGANEFVACLIHPSITPSSAPVTRLVNGANGPEPAVAEKRSSTGRSSRWNDATLARTHPLRSVTRARAGPAAERSPVHSATRSSAMTVNCSKSGTSDWAWYESANGSRPATRTATRSANDQSTADGVTVSCSGTGAWTPSPRSR